MRHKNFNKILQFKITLEDIRPPVWRRIQVPDYYTFWDLHVAIQDSMGWLDSHLHHFEVYFPESNVTIKTGIPDEDGEENILPGWQEGVARCFEERKPKIRYTYDYGDDWNHAVKFEGIRPREAGRKYPLCLDGRRACPPEDCGGPYSYPDLLKIIADKEHEEHESTLTWLGGKFDPERFDPGRVAFDDPRSRWKIAFS
jgi:hypothetical protein